MINRMKSEKITMKQRNKNFLILTTKRRVYHFWAKKKWNRRSYRKNSWFENGKFFESKTDENWLIWPYSFQIHWSDLDSFFFIPFFFWMTLEQNLESIYNRNILWIMKQKRNHFWKKTLLFITCHWLLFAMVSFKFLLFWNMTSFDDILSFQLNVITNTHMILNWIEDSSFYLEFSFSLFLQYILNHELIIIMNIYWPISFINHWIINIKRINE